MKKKLNLFMIFFIGFIVNVINTNAECTVKEQQSYQNLLDNVKITYKHENELLDENNELVTGYFSIYIEGLNDELALYNPERDMLVTGKTGETIKKFGFVHGTYEFRLFVNNSVCNSANRNINITFPKYNTFSDSYLCNGIDAKEFLPCSKWYEYDLDEKTFLIRIKEYKESKEKKDNNIVKKVEKEVVNIFEKITESISNNLIWYLIGLVIIIALIIYLIYYLRKKKKENSKWK